MTIYQNLRQRMKLDPKTETKLAQTFDRRNEADFGNLT
jgi:hypothetical protein